VYHPDGFILVNHYSASLLIKVPINKDGSAGAPVICADHRVLKEPNGLVRLTDSKVLVHTSPGVLTLTSASEWDSKVNVDSVKPSPIWVPPFYSPTSLLVGNLVYALASDLPKYFTRQPSSDFYVYTLRNSNIPGLYDGVGPSKGYVVAVVIILLICAIAGVAAVWYHYQSKNNQQGDRP